MKWSKYNLVFNSDKFGVMVYNSLSNRVMTFSDDFQTELEKIESNPKEYDFSKNFKVFTEMVRNKILITSGGEKDLLNSIKMKKLASRFDPSIMTLTIMVTEDCNFGCPYCYEKNKRHLDMSDEVQNKLIEFIKVSMPKHLSIVWFGGEPLMRFDIIKRLNKKIKELNISYNSMIVTNGWFLTEDITSYFEELRVSLLQVTIEGPAHIHNKKRFHLEHGDSFDVIESNLNRLMLKEKWPGRLLIHYNIDKTNKDCLANTYDYWIKKYPKGNIGFGPSFVDRNLRGTDECSRSSFTREDEISFYLEHYKKHGGKGLNYFPKRFPNGCCANNINSYVVGAAGQLYKCWDDVGKKDMEVGSLLDENHKIDMQKASRYLVGVDSFDNKECQSCFFLPVCEECPNIRYRKKYLDQDISGCINYKECLPKFLEIHLEMQQKNNEKIEKDVF